jgi:hypothetical protein
MENRKNLTAEAQRRRGNAEEGKSIASLCFSLRRFSLRRFSLRLCASAVKPLFPPFNPA